jgi:hypothetical protein
MVSATTHAMGIFCLLLTVRLVLQLFRVSLTRSPAAVIIALTQPAVSLTRRTAGRFLPVSFAGHDLSVVYTLLFSLFVWLTLRGIGYIAAF